MLQTDQRSFPPPQTVAVNHLEEQCVAAAFPRNRSEKPLNVVLRQIDDSPARRECNDIHPQGFPSEERDLHAFTHSHELNLPSRVGGTMKTPIVLAIATLIGAFVTIVGCSKPVDASTPNKTANPPAKTEPKY